MRELTQMKNPTNVCIVIRRLGLQVTKLDMREPTLTFQVSVRPEEMEH